MLRLVKFISKLVALVLIANAAFSQAWRPAKVVRTAGDTVSGEVRFADPDISPTGFEFRNKQQPKEIVLTTETVVSFRLDDSGQIFQTLEAAIETLFTSAVPSGRSPVKGKEEIKVFAEVLIAGLDVKLYLVYDSNKQEHFFIRKGGELTELIFRQYQVHKDGTVYNAEESLYKSQLKQIFSDCPAIQKRGAEYDEKSLTRYVNAYISCQGGAATFEQSVHAQLGLGATGGYLIAKNGSNGDDIGAGLLSVSGQLLSRKFSGNRFVWIDFGALLIPDVGSQFYFGAVAGTYFGNGKVRPLIGGGFSNIGSFWQVAAGVGFNKKVVLAVFAIPNYEVPIYSARLTVLPFRPK